MLTQQKMQSRNIDKHRRRIVNDGGGDVKYHRGYSGTVRFDDDREIHLTLTSNPSHLEAVDPVVLGRTRSKQRMRGDLARQQVVPLLIHGDAAIAGQGIVAEGYWREGKFTASEVLAKHDENYVPRELQDMDEHQAAEMARETTIGIE